MGRRRSVHRQGDAFSPKLWLFTQQQVGCSVPLEGPDCSESLPAELIPHREEVFVSHSCIVKGLRLAEKAS